MKLKSVGSLNSTTRTAEQTEIGYFWADSGPLLWQNALRYISRNYVTQHWRLGSHVRAG